jgi:hypothetical protein
MEMIFTKWEENNTKLRIKIQCKQETKFRVVQGLKSIKFNIYYM